MLIEGTPFYVPLRHNLKRTFSLQGRATVLERALCLAYKQEESAGTDCQLLSQQIITSARSTWSWEVQHLWAKLTE